MNAKEKQAKLLKRFPECITAIANYMLETEDSIFHIDEQLFDDFRHYQLHIAKRTTTTQYPCILQHNTGEYQVHFYKEGCGVVIIDNTIIPEIGKYSDNWNMDNFTTLKKPCYTLAELPDLLYLKLNTTEIILATEFCEDAISLNTPNVNRGTVTIPDLHNLGITWSGSRTGEFKSFRIGG